MPARHILDAEKPEIINKCHLRQNSNREKMLRELLKNSDGYIPESVLARKIYRDRERKGPLYMVSVGLCDKLKKSRTHTELKRANMDGELHYGVFKK